MGISFDTAAENAAFAEKYGFPYPLLCDTTREVGVAYGACSGPDASSARRVTFVIGPEGTIRYIVEDVKAAEHPALVLASLM